ncbi:hypothetical protein KO561_19730 [Radiobacillus kanasensis]|nr:hypothetical protein [Radiobacillus kanasensis]UFT99368.1 hypothetical protein KO561_19730 [Radiobacillus kanasensis]
MAVELLFVHYYDPRYEYSVGYAGNQQIFIKAVSVDEVIEKIKRGIE